MSSRLSLLLLRTEFTDMLSFNFLKDAIRKLYVLEIFCIATFLKRCY